MQDSNFTRGMVRVATLDYVSFVTLSIQSLSYYWERFRALYSPEYSVPASFVQDLKRHCQIDPVDVFLVVFLAVLWTLLRIEFTEKFFTPWSNRLCLLPSNKAKFPESVWKLIFYSCTWSWSLYVMLFSSKYMSFWDPLSIWDEWEYGMSVPWDIYVTYVVQASFYLHSLYATINLDVWRKDSIVMIVHHFLTLVLIGFSFAARHHMIGALVLLLHDVTDVELEFTKLNSYLKRRGGLYYFVHDSLANLGFACFAISWFLFRLYWYPLKVLYVAGYGTIRCSPPDLPFIPMFNVMLWLLLAMNIWWFHFILVLLYKVASGQMSEVDDTREYEQEKQRLADLQKNGNLPHQNGTLCPNPSLTLNGKKKD